MQLRSGTADEAGLWSSRIGHGRGLCRKWVADGVHPSIVVLVARHGVVCDIRELDDGTWLSVNSIDHFTNAVTAAVR